MPVEAAAGVLGTPRWAMAEALDLVAGKFGGSAVYARTQCDLTADDLALLRASMLIT